MAFRLTPKEDSFYELFGVSAGHLVDAAKELTNLLAVQTPEDRKTVVDRMHDLEHLGDEATHEIMRRVNASFITPFDREDIYRLAAALDDVVDAMEAAADFVVLADVGPLPKLMGEQIALLRHASTETADAMSRLATLKDLEPYWIEVNRLENEADRVYRKLLSKLFSGDYDALKTMKLREVADQLEGAADALEHVAHAVESIAVKES